ncbi:hypothetical protein MMC12_000404 [Toensbergia leucococca]|nr:hypothetical protein [Toensbergia leucococca]
MGEMSKSPPPGYVFPPEGHPHRRTIMAWPTRVSLPAILLEGVRNELADLARTISLFEPVTMYVSYEDLDDARARIITDSANDPQIINLAPFPVNHCWVRDTGPVYVFSATSETARYALNFGFNEWGGKVTGVSGDDSVEWGQIWPPFDTKSLADNTAFARRVIDSDAPAVERIDPKVILEGGGLVVDGDGTLLISESCIIDEGRNPGWTKSEVEHELKRLLGIEKVVWFPGIKNFDITDCHMDAAVRFVRPGVVVVSRPHSTQPKEWTNVFDDTMDILQKETDARGREFEITTIYEPSIKELLIDPSFETCTSYVNFYMCNSGIVAPKFGVEKEDREALEIMKKIFPDREVRQVYINAVGQAGGGIHCVTQQVPHANLRLAEIRQSLEKAPQGMP